MNDYQQRLFRNYKQSHASYLDSSLQSRLVWFSRYFDSYYRQYLDESDKPNLRILEIGCGEGWLLSILSDRGFNHLTGVDMSPEDIQKGHTRWPLLDLICADAMEFLREKSSKFDVILLKAVLEHVSKTSVMPFLELIDGALSPKGVVIIDVPNMDWLFASHERYLDFTHESGFTKESLAQIMRNVFSNVEITPADNLLFGRWPKRLARRAARSVIRSLLYIADPEGAGNPIWARSLVGVGRRKHSVNALATD